MLIKAKDAECGSSMATIERRFMALAHEDCATARSLSNATEIARCQSQPKRGSVRSTAARSSSQMETAVVAHSASG